MFSPDGKFIAAGNNDNSVRIWDLATQRIVQTLIHPAAAAVMSYSPDGKFIWTSSTDGKVRQWETRTGQLVRVFSGPRGYSGIDLSPDGKFVLISDSNNTVRLYDVDYHDTIRYACSRLLRDLTTTERQAYDIKDTKSTCPNP